jgi:hypothetical protein
MNRAELLGLLNDSVVRQRLENCIAEHANSADSIQEPAAACVSPRQPGDFEKQARSWNPKLSTWNRSPKE